MVYSICNDSAHVIASFLAMTKKIRFYPRFRESESVSSAYYDKNKKRCKT